MRLDKQIISKMAASTSCSICCHDVAQYSILQCPKCNFEVCHSCVVNFVKTLSGDVTCMSCKQEWDRSFIYRQLPASIVYKELKSQREQMLVDRETALLPATSQIIPLVKRQACLKGEIDKLKSELRNKMDELADITRRKNEIENEILGRPGGGEYHQKEETKKSPKVVCQCPANDCRGFVFNGGGFKCNLCDIEICKKCHVIVTSDAKHSCKQEDVASVECIKKECKACPGCGTPSRKTEGCSQVWCLVCHKAWNWNNGQLEHGAIHATDYFNYMRRNGLQIPPPNERRNAGAADHCRPLDMFRVVYDLKQRFPDEISKTDEDFIRYKWRVTQEYVNHMNDTIHAVNNIDLRMKFLSGEIQKDRWKQLLHKRDKEETFKLEIHRMRCAYTAAMMDAFRGMSQVRSSKGFLESIAEVRQLHTIFQKEYVNLAACFKSKKMSPFIHKNEK